MAPSSEDILRHFGYPPGYFKTPDAWILIEQPAPSLKDGEEDPIFVSVDVEGTDNPKDYISEIGISTLDTRDVRWVYGSNLSPPGPGMRGHRWFSYIKSTHILVTDINFQRGRYSTVAHNKFAYRNTHKVPHENLKKDLDRRLQNLRQLHRTDQEKQSGTLRNLIFIVWDSNLERRLFGIWGLGWFDKGAKVWDAQLMDLPLHLAAEKHGKGAKLKLKDALDTLGIQYGNLLHNGGNDSAFELQCMLALAFLSDAEYKSAIEGDPKGLNLWTLPETWHEQTVERNNKAVAPLAHVPTALLAPPAPRPPPPPPMQPFIPPPDFYDNPKYW